MLHSYLDDAPQYGDSVFGNELFECYEKGALEGNGALDVGQSRVMSVGGMPKEDIRVGSRSGLVLRDGIPKDIYEGSCNIRKNGDQQHEFTKLGRAPSALQILPTV